MADEEEKETPEEEEKEEAPAEGEEAAEGEEGEGGEEGEDGEEKPKSGKKKLILLIVAVLVLLGGAGAGAFFFMGMSGEETTDEPQQRVILDEDGNEIIIDPNKAVYVDLDEFIVNLNTGTKQSSFLKMTVTIELESYDDKSTIESNIPRIRDAFQIYLRELRASDLQGSAGIHRLREELLLRINKSLHPVKIRDILFKEIIVQ